MLHPLLTYSRLTSFVFSRGPAVWVMPFKSGTSDIRPWQAYGDLQMLPPYGYGKRLVGYSVGSASPMIVGVPCTGVIANTIGTLLVTATLFSVMEATDRKTQPAMVALV